MGLERVVERTWTVLQDSRYCWRIIKLRRWRMEQAALLRANSRMKTPCTRWCHTRELGWRHLERALPIRHWDPPKRKLSRVCSQRKEWRECHKQSARGHIPCAGRRSHETHSWEKPSIGASATQRALASMISVPAKLETLTIYFSSLFASSNLQAARSSSLLSGNLEWKSTVENQRETRPHCPPTPRRDQVFSSTWRWSVQCCAIEYLKMSLFVNTLKLTEKLRDLPKLSPRRQRREIRPSIIKDSHGRKIHVVSWLNHTEFSTFNKLVRIVIMKNTTNMMLS